MSRAGEDGHRDEHKKNTNVQQWTNLTPEEEQEEVLGGRRSSVG